MLAAAMLLVAAPGFAAGDDAHGHAVYRLAAVGFDLAPGDALGPKRAGALCLPRGSISWRESRPNPTEAVEEVVRGLREGGLAVATDEKGDTEPPSQTVILRAQVSALHLSACGPPGWPGRLVNRSRATKGEGVVAILWSIHPVAEPRAVRTVTTCQTFAYRGEDASFPDMTLAGLKEAAKAAAPELSSQHASVAAASSACSGQSQDTTGRP